MLDQPLWVPGLCRMFGTKAAASAGLLAQKTTAWRLWACCRAMMVPRVAFDLVVLFVVKQGLSAASLDSLFTEPESEGNQNDTDCA